MDVNTLFVMLHELREIIVLFDLGFLLVDGLSFLMGNFLFFLRFWTTEMSARTTPATSRSRMLSVSSNQ